MRNPTEAKRPGVAKEGRERMPEGKVVCLDKAKKKTKQNNNQYSCAMLEENPQHLS